MKLMKFKSKKIWTMVIAVFIVFLSLLTSAYASHNTPLYSLYLYIDGNKLLEGEFTPRLTTDPDDATYFLSTSTYFTAYQSLARQGVEAWNSTQKNIDLTETTNYSSSVIDVKSYAGNETQYEAHLSANGFTRLCCGDGAYGSNNTMYDDLSLMPDDTDYWLAEVYINRGAIPANTLSTNSGKHKMRVVTAHEVGHALGLGHQSSSSFIMFIGYDSEQSTSPASSEKQAVRNLYNVVR